MSSSKFTKKSRNIPKLPKKIKNTKNSQEDQEIEEVEEEERYENPKDSGPMISRHVYLKPVHSTETLDKEVVLRQIRHHKRFNRVKIVMKTLFSSPFSGSKSSVGDKKWLDDAFAAP